MESISRQIIKESNDKYELAGLSVIGDRDAQEDCFAFTFTEGEVLVVLCDGMGGFQKGSVAGALTAEIVIKEYNDNYPYPDVQELIEEALKEADKRISAFTDKNGKRIEAGTTAVVVSIQSNNLNWVSVGDSRAYLFRNGQYAQLTKDHTYRTVLKEQIRADIIDINRYNQEINRGGTLINYVGIGGLSLTDHNSHPFELMKGDVIMLMTDGLYKLVDGEEMTRIVSANSDLSACIEQLEMRAQEVSDEIMISRDNMTVVMVKVL